MKKALFLSMLLSPPATAATATAPTKLSIVAFENKANSTTCRFDGDGWWRDNIGDAFKEMLIGEIKKHSRFKLYERSKIKSVYENEHALPNSENATKRAKGNFQVADFTIAGVVSEFEYCSSGREGGIRLGGLGLLNDLSVGTTVQTAKVVVDVRAIDTETGEITSQIQAAGEIKDGALNVGASLGPVSANLGGHEGTPIAQAARLAIQKAADELLPKIP